MVGGGRRQPEQIAEAILARTGYAERVSALGALAADELVPAAQELLLRSRSIARTDPAEAMERAQLAVSVASVAEDACLVLAASSALAQGQVALGRFADALATTDAALRRAAHARVPERDRRETEIVRIGALVNLERYDEARRSAVTALSRCDLDRDLRGQIWLRMTLADLDYRQDLPREALRRYREVDALLPASAAPALRATVAVNRGNSLAATQRFRAAERAFAEGGALFLAAGHDHAAATAAYDAAYLDLTRARYGTALRRFAEVEETFRRFGDERHLAHLDLDRAEAHLHLHLGHDARRLAVAARSRFDGLGLRKEAASASLFAARGSILEGDLEAAESDLRTAAAAYQALGLSDRLLVTLVECASLAMARRDLAAAGERLAEADALVRPTTDVWARVALHLARGRLALARGLVARALEAAREAWSARGRALSASMGLELHWLTARASAAAGREADALVSYERAVGELERCRTGVPPDEYMTSFLAGRSELYREIVDLLVRRGDTAVAFHYVERSRARALAELIARGPAADVGPDSRRIAYLRERLNAIYRRLASVRDDGERGLRAAERDLESAERVEEEMARLLRERMLAAGPEAGLHGADAPTLAEVQAALPEGTSMVQFVQSAAALLAFVVTRDTLRVVRQDLAPEELDEPLRRLRFHVTAPGTAARRGGSAVTAAAAEGVLADLSAVLLAPIASLLGGERVVIVPHGTLHDVPFHALPFDGGALVDRFEVVYAPSAAVFVACGRRPADACGAPVVLALPDEEAPRILDEARRAAHHLGATVFLGDEATFARLAEACRTARIVHVATHGMFRRAHPTLSALRLADRWINLYDVYGLDVRGELVVLSTCESGTAEVSSGDELVGLARGFLRAGARTLLTTQWAVDDEATAAFMDAFHGALASGADVAAAHREAVREVRRLHPHPAHWGAFFVIGHPTRSPASVAPRRAPAPAVVRSTAIPMEVS